jgi:hypothetical protein
MEVTLAQTCSRCGKTKAVPVDVSEVIKAQEKQKKQEELLKIFRSQINETIPAEFGPEIIVCYSTDNGYGVKVLETLCDTPEGTKKRKGCKQRVKTLLDDIFNVGPKKKASPPKKAAPKKNGDKGKGKN